VLKWYVISINGVCSSLLCEPFYYYCCYVKKNALNSQDNPGERETFVKETLSRLSTSLDLKEAVKNTDLVVEAVVENLDLKHKLFSSIDSVCTISYIILSHKCLH
jgi:3-hydroxyacyl-CoA dehydrogenase